MNGSRSNGQPPVRASRLESALAILLRAGVVTSLVVVLAGLVVGFVRHPEWLTDQSALHAVWPPREAVRPDIVALLAGLLRLESRSLVLAGVLVLIATPVLRVVLAAVGFARAGVWVYVALCATVLALLGLSIVVGHAG